jgi:hypothetical protein
MRDQDGDLYVDLNDEPLVRRLLDGVDGLAAGEPEKAPELGLARVRLSGVAEAVARLSHGPELPPGVAAAAEAASAGDDPRLRLDVLIGLVRQWGSQRFDGWQPTLDRNHDDGSVTTSPHVKIGGAEDPAEVEPPPAGLPPGFPDGPRVGIADARMFAHPDLAGRYVGEPVASGPFLTRGPGHAAFVAGTVLREAPRASLVCRTVLVHYAPNWSWDVARRLMAFCADDLDVLNMSFGCFSVDGVAPLPLRRAVERLSQRTVLVAAAGNYGRDDGPKALYPAAFDQVLAVGSADEDGTLASTTPTVPWLDLHTQGVRLVGPYLIGTVTEEGHEGEHRTGYVTWSGSSFAAAAVSGRIAQLMTERRIGATEARDVLLSGSTSSTSAYVFDVTRTGLLDDLPAGAEPG